MRSAPAKNSSLPLLQKLRPPEAGKKILIAVSGGLDSMVLLHTLKALSKTHCWKLVVAHFNHRLRGRASNGDEGFVRKTAARINLPFIAGMAEVKKIASEQKISVEMAARKLRHEFFAQTARKLKINTVALAHHADDQVELFFLRLLRGAGGGIAGMRWQSCSPADKNISLIRPLLEVSKTELEQHARENKIYFREDVTNLSLDFLRNRIRHELLPLLLKNYQPGLNKTILRFMEIAGGESDFVSETARSWLRGRGGGLPAKKDFEKLSVAIQRQILRLQLFESEISADFDLIESLRRAPNQPVAVNAGLFVSRDLEGRVNRHKHQTARFTDRQLTVKLKKRGLTIFDGVKLKWQFDMRRAGSSQFTPPAKRPGTELFDGDKTGEEIILRNWRAGDRFQPIGLKSAIKLQDLFTNQKISRDRRHKLVVAEAGGEIFWVEGLRISENFKVTSQTKRLLVWQWRR
jgi:tRNA(Ile)-lysidine synthase